MASISFFLDGLSKNTPVYSTIVRSSCPCPFFFNRKSMTSFSNSLVRLISPASAACTMYSPPGYFSVNSPAKNVVNFFMCSGRSSHNCTFVVCVVCVVCMLCVCVCVCVCVWCVCMCVVCVVCVVCCVCSRHFCCVLCGCVSSLRLVLCGWLL